MTIEKQLKVAVRAAMKRGESQNRIAEEAGIDPATLSKWRAGKRSISLETAERLAGYFGLELS